MLFEKKKNGIDIKIIIMVTLIIYSNFFILFL